MVPKNQLLKMHMPNFHKFICPLQNIELDIVLTGFCMQIFLNICRCENQFTILGQSKIEYFANNINIFQS